MADYNVSGAITPDATGDYFETGTFEGQPYYKHETAEWYIWWWSEYETWAISAVLGEKVLLDAWYRIDPAIAGAYDPAGSHEGTATVTAGPA